MLLLGVVAVLPGVGLRVVIHLLAAGYALAVPLVRAVIDPLGQVGQQSAFRHDVTDVVSLLGTRFVAGGIGQEIGREAAAQDEFVDREEFTSL
jgi:hypothetical protein